MPDDTPKTKPYYPEAIKPHKVTGSHHYAVVPEGHKLADLRPFWSEPLRFKADPVFHRLEDFAQYLKTFRMEKEIGREPAYAPPMVWANLQEGTMEAVLDHPSSFWNKEHSWQDHTARFQPQEDPHWQIWEQNDNAVSEKKFNQAGFLEFLQANRWDIVDGALRFFCRRERPEQIVENVFEEWEGKIKLTVGVEVMYGRNRKAEVVL